MLITLLIVPGIWLVSAIGRCSPMVSVCCFCGNWNWALPKRRSFC